jgi:hypothetical protein
MVGTPWRKPPRSIASLLGLGVLVAGIGGCASGPDRSQQLIAAESATSSRFIHYGPDMISYLEPVGTDVAASTTIPADSAKRITVISATLIAVPGFRSPQLISTGVTPAHCRQLEVIQPSVKNDPINVTIGGHPVRPTPLRGYTMEIGAGCVQEVAYAIRARSTGQYAAGGLRLLVRYDGRTQTMYTNDGLDVWYYNSSWLPTASQVTHGLSATFAAQVALYRREG